VNEWHRSTKYWWNNTERQKSKKLKVKTFIMLAQMIHKVTTWLQAVNKTLLVAHLAVGIAF